jgi:Skp family chaperone for outer membrane proteins
MNPRTTACVISAALLPLTVLPLIAQGPPGREPRSHLASPPPQVAVIDIKHILANDVRLACKLTGLLTETEKAAEQFTGEESAIQRKRKAMLQYKVDVPEHQRLYEEIAKEEARIQAVAAARRQMFQRMEARLYYSAYEEIVAAVEAISGEHGISLVLSYDSESVDTDAPEDIDRVIGRSVVFQHRLNLTEDVLQKINRDATPEDKSKQFALKLRPTDELRATGLKFTYHLPVAPTHYPFSNFDR